MVSMLDLPDELLLKILAWIPFQPGDSHDHLHTVSRRFCLLMQTSSLPLALAQSQYDPFMRLRRGFRGDDTELDWDELSKVWRIIRAREDWIVCLQKRSDLSRWECLASASVTHFMATAGEKFLKLQLPEKGSGFGLWSSPLFLVRVISALPPLSLLLLRFVIRKTMEDIHDRHAPYNTLQHLPNQLNRQSRFLSSQTKKFSLACVFETQYILLSASRQMYKLMTDRGLYDCYMKLWSWKAASALDLMVNHTPNLFDFVLQDCYLGAFAIHIRLVQLSEEGLYLHPTNIKIPADTTIEDRLDLEYERMELINAQIEKKFSGTGRAEVADHLPFEAIGRVLGKYSDTLGDGHSNMDDMDVSQFVEIMHENYLLDKWP